MAGTPNEEEKKTFRQLNNRLGEFVQSIRQLEAENEALKLEIEAARSIPDRDRVLEDSLRALRNEVEKLKADKKARERDVAALDDGHQALIRDNAGLVGKLREADQEKKRLEDQKKNLEKELGTSEAAELEELARLRGLLADKEKEARDTYDQIQRNNLDKLEQEKKKWEAHFKAEKEKLEDKHQQATEVKEGEIAALENEIHKVKVEIAHLRDEAAQVKIIIADLEEEIERLKRKIADSDVSNTDPELVHTKKALEDKKKALEDQIADLKRHIQSRDDEIDELTKANIAFRNEIQTYKNLLEGVPVKKARTEQPQPQPQQPSIIVAKFDKVVHSKQPLKLVPKKSGTIDILNILLASKEVNLINHSMTPISIDGWSIKAKPANTWVESNITFPKGTVVPVGTHPVAVTFNLNFDVSLYGAGTAISLFDARKTLVSQVDIVESTPSEQSHGCTSM